MPQTRPSSFRYWRLQHDDSAHVSQQFSLTSGLQMKNHDEEVVIIGAGPVGLIAAHELARRNIRPRLIEKRPGPSHTTRAFTLHARTMEMFEHIGVAHRIEEVSLPCPGNVYHFEGLSEDEKPHRHFRQLPSRYPFYYKINQNGIERVLREHLLSHYGTLPE